MNKAIILTLLATLSLSAFDSDIKPQCKEEFEIMIGAKGTPMQNATFDQFLECQEPECYSLSGAFLPDEGCTEPSYFRNGIYSVPDYIEAIEEERDILAGLGH